MSAPPEVPGFYYDPERRKYFKIVNGDQRYNSQYTNNAVRSRDRRKEFQNQWEPDDDPVPALCSTIAQKFKTFSTLSSRLLDSKLGTHCLSKGVPTVLALTGCNEFVRSGHYSIWPLTDELLIYLTMKGHISLNRVSEVLWKGMDFRKVNLATMHFDGGSIHRVSSWKDWTYVHYGELKFALLRWVVSRGAYHVEDHTTKLVERLMKLEPQDFIDLDILSGKLFGTFHGRQLHILSDLGWHVSLQLPNLTDATSYCVTPTTFAIPDDSIQCILENALGFTSGTKFFLCNRFEEDEWNFADHIHHLFAEEFAKGYRFIVVTVSTVFIFNVQVEASKTASTNCTRIPIANDNNTKPICMKIGDQLLIQESQGVFRHIDLETKYLSRLDLNSFAKFRYSKWGYRLLKVDGKFFLCSQTSTFELTNYELEVVV